MLRMPGGRVWQGMARLCMPMQRARTGSWSGEAEPAIGWRPSGNRKSTCFGRSSHPTAVRWRYRARSVATATSGFTTSREGGNAHHFQSGRRSRSHLDSFRPTDHLCFFPGWVHRDFQRIRRRKRQRNTANRRTPRRVRPGLVSGRQVPGLSHPGGSKDAAGPLVPGDRAGRRHFRSRRLCANTLQ